MAPAGTARPRCRRHSDPRVLVTALGDGPRPRSRRHLSLEGIKVHTSNAPHEALRKVGEHVFGIEITVIGVPECADRNGSGKSKAPCPLANVLVTAGYSGMSSSMVDCFAFGAVDYFTMPLQRMDLFLSAVAQCRERVERWRGAIRMGSQDVKSNAV